MQSQPTESELQAYQDIAASVAEPSPVIPIDTKDKMKADSEAGKAAVAEWIEEVNSSKIHYFIFVRHSGTI